MNQQTKGMYTQRYLGAEWTWILRPFRTDYSGFQPPILLNGNSMGQYCAKFFHVVLETVPRFPKNGHVKSKIDLTLKWG